MEQILDFLSQLVTGEAGVWAGFVILFALFIFGLAVIRLATGIGAIFTGAGKGIENVSRGVAEGIENVSTGIRSRTDYDLQTEETQHAARMQKINNQREIFNLGLDVKIWGESYNLQVYAQGKIAPQLAQQIPVETLQRLTSEHVGAHLAHRLRTEKRLLRDELSPQPQQLPPPPQTPQSVPRSRKFPGLPFKRKK